MKRLLYFIILFIFILIAVINCRSVEKETSVMLYINEEPVLVGEFYSLLQDKKEDWDFYEGSSGTDFELKHMVLRELIIEKIIIEYGMKRNIEPEEDDFYEAINSVFGDAEYFNIEENIDDLKRNYMADYILAAAIENEVTVTDEEIEDYSGKILNRTLEPESLFLIEFHFDNELNAGEFLELVENMDEFEMISEAFHEYKLSNPNADMNILGYLPVEKAGDMLKGLQDMGLNSFSGIIEGSDGFMLYYIRDRKEEKMMTEKDIRDRAMLSIKIEKEREAKNRFIKELFKKAEIRIIVNDKDISEIIEKINREFKGT